MSKLNLILLLVAVGVLTIAGIVAVINQNEEIVPDDGTPVVQSTPGPTPAPTPDGAGRLSFPKMPDWLIEAPDARAEITEADDKPELPPLSEAELQALREDIYSGDPGKRKDAFDALGGYLTQSRGVPLLNELVLSEDEDIQYNVISVLPNLPAKDRLPVLTRALDNKTSEFRANIMAASRDFVGLDMNEFLTKAMTEKDEDTLEEATTLYFYFSDHDIYEAAFEGVKHPNADVRDRAMEVFETKHTAKSILLLIEILKSPYSDMRQRAGDALRLITDAWHIESNDYDTWVRWAEEHGKEWVRKYDPQALRDE